MWSGGSMMLSGLTIPRVFFMDLLVIFYFQSLSLLCFFFFFAAQFPKIKYSLRPKM